MSFNEDSVEGIAILLWATDPRVPERLATPFFHAAAAAAMDLKVEVYFTAASVRLLVPGLADDLKANDRVDMTIGDAMRNAHSHGAKFLACTEALHAMGVDRTLLIPQCDGFAGAVQFMLRASDRRWQTLSY